jgi:transglycosylase-like protein with SLT domain
MSDSQVGLGAARMALLASVAFACGSGSAAGDPAGGAHLLVLPGLSAGQPLKAETVRFADPRHRSVQVMRGALRPEAAPPGVEFLGFGSTGAQQVRVVRGPVVSLDLPGLRRVETVSFSEAGRSSVTVVRGGLEPQLVAGLFRAAGGRTPERRFSVDLFETSGGDLDRIAFAVDGVESNHGQNPLMWRPTPDGPQGPMQVSLKAALDVGGGNRFDLRENRLLGRAYLAQMFQRYGNWSDALAAYNWGPGNLEAWIAAGRPAERLPSETARYVRRVLRDALVASANRW